LKAQLANWQKHLRNCVIASFSCNFKAKLAEPLGANWSRRQAPPAPKGTPHPFAPRVTRDLGVALALGCGTGWHFRLEAKTLVLLALFECLLYSRPAWMSFFVIPCLLLGDKNSLGIDTCVTAGWNT
jgi:hypothetical protein